MSSSWSFPVAALETDEECADAFSANLAETHDETFDVGGFVADALDTAHLQTLREHLALYLQSIRSRLIESVDSHFEDFVKLSRDLDGVDSSLQDLRVPLDTARGALERLRETVRSRLEEGSSLRHRRDAAHRRVRALERLRSALQRLTELESGLNAPASVSVVELQRRADLLCVIQHDICPANELLSGNGNIDGNVVSTSSDESDAQLRSVVRGAEARLDALHSSVGAALTNRLAPLLSLDKLSDLAHSTSDETRSGDAAGWADVALPGMALDADNIPPSDMELLANGLWAMHSLDETMALRKRSPKPASLAWVVERTIAPWLAEALPPQGLAANVETCLQRTVSELLTHTIAPLQRAGRGIPRLNWTKLVHRETLLHVRANVSALTSAALPGSFLRTLDAVYAWEHSLQESMGIGADDMLQWYQHDSTLRSLCDSWRRALPVAADITESHVQDQLERALENPCIGSSRARQIEADPLPGLCLRTGTIAVQSPHWSTTHMAALLLLSLWSDPSAWHSTVSAARSDSVDSHDGRFLAALTPRWLRLSWSLLTRWAAWAESTVSAIPSGHCGATDCRWSDGDATGVTSPLVRVWADSRAIHAVWETVVAHRLSTVSLPRSSPPTSNDGIWTVAVDRLTSHVRATLATSLSRAAVWDGLPALAGVESVPTLYRLTGRPKPDSASAYAKRFLRPWKQALRIPLWPQSEQGTTATALQDAPESQHRAWAAATVGSLAAAFAKGIASAVGTMRAEAASMAWLPAGNDRREAEGESEWTDAQKVGAQLRLDAVQFAEDAAALGAPLPAWTEDAPEDGRSREETESTESDRLLSTLQAVEAPSKESLVMVPWKDATETWETLGRLLAPYKV